MDFKFYCAPQSYSEVNQSTTFKSSDLLEVISHATKQHLISNKTYDVYLVFELSYNFSKPSLIYKKLFTISDKSILPCIYSDTDFVKL